MKLERMMTVEVDLPDAPAGCEWQLESDSASPVVQLRRGGVVVGGVFGSGKLAPVLWSAYASGDRIASSEATTTREAALAMFGALGLEVHP